MTVSGARKTDRVFVTLQISRVLQGNSPIKEVRILARMVKVDPTSTI